jgi:hypothetical protein
MPISHMRATNPDCLILLDLITRIIIGKASHYVILPLSYNFLCLRSDILLSTLFLNTLNLRFFPLE